MVSGTTWNNVVFAAHPMGGLLACRVTPPQAVRLARLVVQDRRALPPRYQIGLATQWGGAKRRRPRTNLSHDLSHRRYTAPMTTGSVKAKVLSGQRRWAVRAGLVPDARGYLASVADNLRAEMSERARKAFDVNRPGF